MTIAGVAYYFPDVGRSEDTFEGYFKNQGAKEAGGLPSFYTKDPGSARNITNIFRKNKMAGWTTHVAVATWGWKKEVQPPEFNPLSYVLTPQAQKKEVSALEDQQTAYGIRTKVAISSGLSPTPPGSRLTHIKESREDQLVADPNIGVPGYIRVTPNTTFPVGSQVRMPRIRGR
jgi:hypothetical protein